MHCPCPVLSVKTAVKTSRVRGQPRVVPSLRALGERRVRPLQINASRYHHFTIRSSLGQEFDTVSGGDKCTLRSVRVAHEAPPLTQLRFMCCPPGNHASADGERHLEAHALIPLLDPYSSSFCSVLPKHST